MGVLEPFFCFVCSDGEDVIRAFYDVFNAGAPRYGGSAACYQANTGDLMFRSSPGLRFDGTRIRGTMRENAWNVSDVLAQMRSSHAGKVLISFVTVDQSGKEWVEEACTMLMGQYSGRFHLSAYTTMNREAAQFVLGSFRRMNPPMTEAEIVEMILKPDQNKISPTSELSHHFICSNNPSLIKYHHDLFRVGAPTYGGSAGYYHADYRQLCARQTDSAAASLLFAGQKFLGSTVEEMRTVADVLSSLSVGAYGGIFISHVVVGPNGQKWVRDIYTTLLEQACNQGILPSYMYMTANQDAAQFLLDSFSPVSAP